MVAHACNVGTPEWRQEDHEFVTNLGYGTRTCYIKGKVIYQKRNKEREKPIHTKI